MFCGTTIQGRRSRPRGRERCAALFAFISARGAPPPLALARRRRSAPVRSAASLGPQALLSARGAPPPRAAARSLEDSLLAAAAGALQCSRTLTVARAAGAAHSASRPSTIDHRSSTIGHDVIAYTTTLTANFVLSSRWKRLFLQS